MYNKNKLNKHKLLIKKKVLLLLHIVFPILSYK